jgi:hypothetical protein
VSLSPLVDGPGRTVVELEQTAVDLPGRTVVMVRTVAHVARLVAVLAVAVRAAILAVEVVWVTQGRHQLDDAMATEGLWLAMSVGMAGFVCWLAARLFQRTSPATG